MIGGFTEAEGVDAGARLSHTAINGNLTKCIYTIPL